MPECVRKHAKMRRGRLESMLESDWGAAKTKKNHKLFQVFQGRPSGRRVWLQIPASGGFQTNEMHLFLPNFKAVSVGLVERFKNFPPHGNQICVPVVPDETDGHGHEFPPRSATGAAMLIPLPRIGATAVVPPDRQSIILEPAPHGLGALAEAAQRLRFRSRILTLPTVTTLRMPNPVYQNERQTPAWHWSRQIRDKPCAFGMAQKPGKR